MFLPILVIVTLSVAILRIRHSGFSLANIRGDLTFIALTSALVFAFLRILVL